MFLAINGSPRLHGNTATLLESALEGVISTGRDARMVHLYKMTYQGCVSCFSCKRKGGKTFCAFHDGLTPLLHELEECEGIILGSPIYFMGLTGAMHSFLERFIFSHFLYTKKNCWHYPKKVPFALFYTWGADKSTVEAESRSLHFMETRLEEMLGTRPEILHSCESWQFDDYSKYEADMFSPTERWERYQNVFPLECKTARKIGEKLATAGTDS